MDNMWILVVGMIFAALTVIGFILVLWLRDRGRQLHHARGENIGLRIENENLRWERSQIDQVFAWLSGGADSQMMHGRRILSGLAAPQFHSPWSRYARHDHGAWSSIFTVVAMMIVGAVILWLVIAKGPSIQPKQPDARSETSGLQQIAPLPTEEEITSEAALEIAKARLTQYLEMRTQATQTLDEIGLSTVLAGNALKFQRKALVVLERYGCHWEFERPQLTDWKITVMNANTFDAYVNIRENAELFCNNKQNERLYTPAPTYYGIHLTFRRISGEWFITDGNGLHLLVRFIAD